MGENMRFLWLDGMMEMMLKRVSEVDGDEETKERAKAVVEEVFRIYNGMS